MRFESFSALRGCLKNSWKINRRDRMSLLLACCKDCIGAISVVEDEPDKPET